MGEPAPHLHDAPEHDPIPALCVELLGRAFERFSSFCWQHRLGGQARKASSFTLKSGFTKVPSPKLLWGQPNVHMLSHLATTLALLRAQALISAASDQSCVCFARSSQYFPGDEKLLLPTDEAAHSRIIMFGISHRRPRPPPRPRLRQARRGSWLACQSRRRRREGGGHCHPRGARLSHRGHGLCRRGHVPRAPRDAGRASR